MILKNYPLLLYATLQPENALENGLFFGFYKMDFLTYRYIILIFGGGSKSRVAKANKLDLFIDDCYDNYKEIKDSGIPCKLYTCSHNLQYDVGSDRIKNMEKI